MTQGHDKYTEGREHHYRHEAEPPGEMPTRAAVEDHVANKKETCDGKCARQARQNPAEASTRPGARTLRYRAQYAAAPQSPPLLETRRNRCSIRRLNGKHAGIVGQQRERPVVLRRVPEFEACVELARAAGVPVRDVLAAAGGTVEEDAE